MSIQTRNILFWIIVISAVGFFPFLFIYEVVISKHVGFQYDFRKQCQSLNGSEFNLTNINSLKGQCLEYRENGTGYALCEEKHLKTDTLFVSSNWLDTGWRCDIEVKNGKMSTNPRWYWD